MKTLIFVLLMTTAGFASAGDKSRIQNVSVPVCVSVSTSEWTAVPSTSTVLSGRGGQMIVNPKSNSANFGIVLSSVASVSVSTSVAMTQLEPGEDLFVDISNKLYLYAVSYHTAAENLCGQQFKFDYP